MTAASREPSEPPASVLILAGTTAAGKTDVSIPLAEQLHGEILSADSRQIFRELNIGTAKPSPEQLARVRHHFINEKSLRERWTAGDFSRAARQRIEEILARGNLPIVVGGSMLYLRALTEGFFDSALPVADYRALRAEWRARGTGPLYAELCERDPELAARINPNDHHRILRGLALCRQGVRLSELQRQPRVPLTRPYRLYFLHAKRAEIYARVNRRVLQMIEAGLVAEVRALAEQGLDPESCHALRTHGYQEVFPYLRGEIAFDDMVDAIQKAVRHYVKRQLTWFRRLPQVVWIERAPGESDEEVACRIAADFTLWAARRSGVP